MKRTKVIQREDEVHSLNWERKSDVSDGARRVRRFGGATVAIVSSGQQEGSESGHKAIRNRNQELKTPNDSKA